VRTSAVAWREETRERRNETETAEYSKRERAAAGERNAERTKTVQPREETERVRTYENQKRKRDSRTREAEKVQKRMCRGSAGRIWRTHSRQ